MELHQLEDTTGDVIRIDDLRVQAYIGVHAYEKGQPQTVRFDIEIETIAGYLDHVSRSGRYVSYADAVDFIEARAATGEHVELVETWALSVADFVLQNDLVERVSVAVSKPDIFANVAGVGIRIVRRRAAAQ